MNVAARALALTSLLALACAPGGEEPDDPPVLRLRSPLLAPVGALVTFDASASVDDHGIVMYSVQFGDGSPEAELSSPIFTHVYREPATYEIEVLALDAPGHRDVLRRSITAVERYWPPYCDDNLPCEWGALCDQGECFIEGEAGSP
ncbi:MAG: PKD domain-containing protein [Pseudomonadota bacterium]